MLRAPELIIFDCDGVLVDSERLSHEVMCQLLAEHGCAMSLAQAVDRFIGTSHQECLMRVQAALGEAYPADFEARFAQGCREAFDARLVAVHGMPELVAQLRVKCCVASNGSHAKVQHTLGLTGLLPHFAGRIFTADAVAQPKPAPDLFLLAAARNGVAPEATWVVEDTPTGVLAAKRAGMHAIGLHSLVSPDRLRAAGADELVASAELLRLRLAAMGVL